MSNACVFQLVNCFFEVGALQQCTNFVMEALSGDKGIAVGGL
jgi:hypothetical protein